MKKILTAVFVLLSLYTSAQKSNEAKRDSAMRMTTGEGEIPPGFAGSNTILVIFKDQRNSVNKYLEKALENEYTGEYRLLEPGEHLSPEDTAKTRYFIKIMADFKAGYFSAGERQGPETEYRMIITDRVTKTMYFSNKSTSCFSCLFKDYFKKLEKLRTKTD